MSRKQGPHFVGMRPRSPPAELLPAADAMRGELQLF